MTINSPTRKGLFLAIIVLALGSLLSADQSGRALRKEIKPEYPALARQAGVMGAVKLEVVIAPSGQVRSVKPMGGHPLLINAAVSAVKQWVFEPAATETTQAVTVKFGI